MIDLVIIPDNIYGIKTKVKAIKWSSIILTDKYLRVRDLASEIFMIADRYGLYCPYLDDIENGITLTWSGYNGVDKLRIYISDKLSYDINSEYRLPMNRNNATKIISYSATMLYPMEKSNAKA